jgi:hypothetical protein
MNFIPSSDPSSSIIPEKSPLTYFPSLGLSKEQLLEISIISLESERDDLLSKVSDLRQLIKRITHQQDQESKRKNRLHEDYQQKIRCLESALHVSETHSAHFSKVKDYWIDFIN